jgi:catechol 2,3-dioxygenase-like lactoylglutathione lyase family enzyme
MYWRLRQICLVARDLEPVVEDLCAVFGLAVGHRDPKLDKFGLQNAILPIGTSFLEIVSPIAPGTTAERYLERRGGDGGYMFITDCSDVAARRRRVDALGVRVIYSMDYEDFVRFQGIQLHPRDSGGCMLEFDHTTGGEDLRGPYYPAGPHWQEAVRTERVRGILGAEIQGPDPERIATRWAEIAERPLTRSPGRPPELRLDLGFARFVPDEDGRGEGLGGIYLDVADRNSILAAAKQRGLEATGESLAIGGVRFHLGA